MSPKGAHRVDHRRGIRRVEKMPNDRIAARHRREEDCAQGMRLGRRDDGRALHGARADEELAHIRISIAASRTFLGTSQQYSPPKGQQAPIFSKRTNRGELFTAFLSRAIAECRFALITLGLTLRAKGNDG